MNVGLGSLLPDREEDNEEFIKYDGNWMRPSKIKKVNEGKEKMKNAIIEEDRERCKRFCKLYNNSVLDNVYEENEHEIKLILRPVKNALYEHYKDGFKEKVKYYFINEKEEEDVLKLNPDEVKEKIKNLMIAYIVELENKIFYRRHINFYF